MHCRKPDADTLTCVTAHGGNGKGNHTSISSTSGHCKKTCRICQEKPLSMKPRPWKMRLFLPAQWNLFEVKEHIDIFICVVHGWLRVPGGYQPISFSLFDSTNYCPPSWCPLGRIDEPTEETHRRFQVLGENAPRLK